VKVSGVSHQRYKDRNRNRNFLKWVQIKKVPPSLKLSTKSFGTFLSNVMENKETVEKQVNPFLRGGGQRCIFYFTPEFDFI
jgi:hypothetical protein